MNYTENRPWGSFENLYEADKYKVKRIVVNPNQSFSLQYHNERSEDWIVVEGYGNIRINDEVKTYNVGDVIHIPTKYIHRATAGSEGLVIIEVQHGTCYEEDIVRLEDDYGRENNK